MRVDWSLRRRYHPCDRRVARRPRHWWCGRYRAAPTGAVRNAGGGRATRLATTEHQEQRAEHYTCNAKQHGEAPHLISRLHGVTTHGRNGAGIWARHHDVHRDRRRHFERGVRLTRAAILLIGDRPVTNRPHRPLGSDEGERELAAGLAGRNTRRDIGCGARPIWNNGRSTRLLVHEECARVGESKCRRTADLSPRKRGDRVLESTFTNDHQRNGAHYASAKQQPTHRRCDTSAPRFPCHQVSPIAGCVVTSKR